MSKNALSQLSDSAPLEDARGDRTALPTLLSIPDACRELGGLSRAQLYRLIAAGEPETMHIGRLIRLTGRSVQAYVDRQVRAERGELEPHDIRPAIRLKGDQEQEGR